MATRYWVLGSGSWTPTNTSNWSDTSGGAGGASVPGPADDVVINNLSGGPGIGVGLTYNANVNSVAISQDYLILNNNTLTTNSLNLTGTAARGVGWGDGVQTLGPASGNIIIPAGNVVASIWATSSDSNVIHTGNRRNVFCTYSGSVGTRSLNLGTATNIENTFIDVFITAGSDNVNFTASGATIGYGSLDFTGFNGNVANIVTGNIRGNLTLSNTMTLPASSSALTFVGPANVTQTITSAGRNIDFPITVNRTVANANIQFNDSFNLANNRAFTLTAGNLIFNDQIINVSIFSSSGSGNRRLIFGNSSTFNITGGNTGTTTLWNTGTATNFLATGNAAINITGNLTSGNRVIASGLLAEANTISFNLTAGSDNINLSGYYKDLNTTGFVGNLLSSSNKFVYGNYVQGVGTNWQTGAGFLQFASTSGVKTIQTNNQPTPIPIRFDGAGGAWQLLSNINMSTQGAQTLSLTNGNLNLNDFTVSTPIVSITGFNQVNVNFGNSGVMNVTSAAAGTVWGASSSTGVTYTGNGLVNFTNTVGTPGARTITHGSTASANSATKAPPMRILSGNLGVTAQGLFTSLDFTGFSGSLAGASRNLYGNMILNANMSVVSTTSVTTFAAPNEVQTIITNGLSVTPFALNVNAANGTFLVTSNMSFGTQVVALGGGTIDTQGFNITAGAFRSPGNSVRTLNAGTSTFTLSGTTSVWNLSTSNIIANVANTSIVLNTSAIINVEFFGNSYTYGNLRLEGNPSVANLSTRISGNNTFTGDFVSNTKTGNYSILFEAGSTNTFKSFFVEGQSGNLVTIDTNGAGIHNLVYTGTGNVNVSNCIIVDSNASPGNTWYALLTNNNTDGGNNTGWIFVGGPVPPVVANGNFFLLFQS